MTTTPDTPPPPRHPGGRPRAPEPRSRVTTYLREADHDRLIAAAKMREQSVAALVRDLLKLKL
jgi:hypothetical protein